MLCNNICKIRKYIDKNLNPAFYKYAKLITILLATLIIFIINGIDKELIQQKIQIEAITIELQELIKQSSAQSKIDIIQQKLEKELLYELYLNDIKNISFGLLVGLFFSFLLAINEIRGFILKSVSSFMTGKSYLSKLSHSELRETINSAYTHLSGGIDIATNKESLFNYIKTLDIYLTKPHKSIVNESLVYEIFNKDKKLFLAERTQEFRIHTLDINEYDTFDIIYRYYGVVEKENLEDFKDNHSIKIVVEDKEILNIDSLLKDKTDELKINEYIEKTKEYNLYFHKKIKLEKEFTKIQIISKKVETIDYSIAIATSDETYTAHYDIVLPEEYLVDNIFHNNTLSSDTKVKQITSGKSKNHAHVNINGWQLPGLSFVLTYKKRD